jgi:hypothetical protein
MELMAEHLGVDTPHVLDPTQGATGREVVSPALHEAVMVLQEQVGIPNGAFDFAALKSAAGVSTITGFVLKPGIVRQ